MQRQQCCMLYTETPENNKDHKNVIFDEKKTMWTFKRRIQNVHSIFFFVFLFVKSDRIKHKQKRFKSEQRKISDNNDYDDGDDDDGKNTLSI